MPKLLAESFGERKKGEWSTFIVEVNRNDRRWPPDGDHFKHTSPVKPMIKSVYNRPRLDARTEGRDRNACVTGGCNVTRKYIFRFSGYTHKAILFAKLLLTSHAAKNTV